MVCWASCRFSVLPMRIEWVMTSSGSGSNANQFKVAELPTSFAPFTGFCSVNTGGSLIADQVSVTSCDAASPSLSVRVSRTTALPLASVAGVNTNMSPRPPLVLKDSIKERPRIRRASHVSKVPSSLTSRSLFVNLKRIAEFSVTL